MLALPAIPASNRCARDFVARRRLVDRRGAAWRLGLAIAHRVADGRDVAGIAQQIVAANLGTVMSDGTDFRRPPSSSPVGC